MFGMKRKRLEHVETMLAGYTKLYAKQARLVEDLIDANNRAHQCIADLQHQVNANTRDLTAVVDVLEENGTVTRVDPKKVPPGKTVH